MRDTLASLSEYEGWVAWVGGRPQTMPDGDGGHMTLWRDGHPIFEAVPARPSLASTIPGASDREVRRADRNTLEWKDLPHAQVHTLELYYARRVFGDQPVVRLDRPEGAPAGWRWIQHKEAGVVAPSVDTPFDEVRRTGISGWRIGCYNPHSQHGPHAIRFIVRPGDGSIQREDLPGHPCWPTSRGGWGLAPDVLGLSAEEVPQPPQAVPT